MGEARAVNAMTQNNNIIWLKEREAQLPDRVGSKAANLAKLCQAGFPVPQGFCITTDALRDIPADNERAESWNNLEGSNEQVQNWISMTLASPSLREEILESYKILKDTCAPDERMAVRSSAPLEDLGMASFAGQYTSILNVATEVELLEAIKKCWASAYSAQAQTYRVRSGVQEVCPRMAVLVQKMIPAEMAGVLFTVDPLNMDKEKLLIEATPGLGDVIASGSVSGFQLSAKRKTFELSHSKGPSSVWTDLYAKYDWTRLLTIGLQIEDLLGGPQDIEWAVRNGDFWILQSRPVTRITKPPCREIWSRANAGEIMPSVVTPLTWSIFKPVLQMAGLYRSRSPLTIHWRWTHPSGKCPDSPRLFRGRAYMELGSAYMGFGCMPGVSPDILRRMLGFEFHLCNKDEIPVKRPRWHIMDIYRGARFWGEMLGFTKSLTRQAGRWTLQHDSVNYQVDLLILGKDSEKIHKNIDQLFRATAKILGIHIQCTSMAFSAVGLLDRLLKKHLEAEKVQGFMSGLVADFQAMGTVQQNMAIWELAQATKSCPAVLEAIVQGESAERIIKKCGSDPDAIQFMALWESFISNYGNRGTEEFELAKAHWDEDPTFVVDRIREIIKNQIPNPQENLAIRHDKWRMECRELYEYIHTKGGRRDAWQFHRLIDAYREYVPLRENLKYHVVSRFNQLRKIFTTLGEELKRMEILSNGNDIYFLHYDEVIQLLVPDSRLAVEIKQVIQKRRNEYNEDAKYKAPCLWISIDGREEPLEMSLTEGIDVLHGIGCSPGIVSGPAFVLNSIGGDAAIETGCVLVAPSIDPGLTPLFLGAAGLVTEIGGVLSHGATVAREYGLPAVVGVPHATEIIKNGQQVTIDGSAGTVYVRGVEL
jgi:rifampicin phosphotransferase